MRKGTTYLIKLVGRHHRKGWHDQGRWDACPLLRILPKIKQPDIVVLARRLHHFTKGLCLFPGHAVSLGQEGDEGDLGGDGLQGARKGGREGGMKGGREGKV